MRRPGFALVMVMMGLVVLGSLGALLATEGRTEVRLSLAAAERARAEAVAEGGIHKALAMIRHPDAALRWPIDGSPQAFTFDDGQVAVRVWDEGGKVDVNQASPPLMVALFTGVTGNAGEGARLARVVVEAREEGGGFQSVRDLRSLPGLDEALYEKLAGFVTVHTRQQGIDGASASSALMTLLAGDEGGTPVSFRTQSRRRVFMIQADATTPGGGFFRRTAIVRLLYADGRPFVIHSWQ